MAQLYELGEGGMGNKDDIIREMYFRGLEKKAPEELKRAYNDLAEASRQVHDSADLNELEDLEKELGFDLNLHF